MDDEALLWDRQVYGVGHGDPDTGPGPGRDCGELPGGPLDGSGGTSPASSTSPPAACSPTTSSPALSSSFARSHHRGHPDWLPAPAQGDLKGSPRPRSARAAPALAGWTPLAPRAWPASLRGPAPGPGDCSTLSPDAFTTTTCHRLDRPATSTSYGCQPPSLKAFAVAPGREEEAAASRICRIRAGRMHGSSKEMGATR